MSQKVLKVAFLAFTGFVLFLLFSNPPDGAEPSLIKKFELDRFLTDIPNLNLNRLQNTFYVKLP